MNGLSRAQCRPVFVQQLSSVALFPLSPFSQGDLLSTAFIDDAPVIAASAEFLKATSIECFVLSIAYCFTGYFNGLGKTTFVMARGYAPSSL